MKKLLVLVLVLAMASLASAAFTVASSAPYTITVTLVDPVQALDVYIDYTPLLAFGITPEQATLTSGAPISALNIQHVDPDGFNLYALSFGSTGTLAAGVMGTLDINGALPNTGAVSVDLDVYNGLGESAGQVSVLVPEPATIALLCLGGLLLRKKK